MYPLSLHTLDAGNWQYFYLAQLLAAAENIYRIRPIESPKPTDGHGWHADDDGSMMPLWFAGDCLPKELIDNEDMPNVEESDDDDDVDDDDVVEEDDFVYDDSDDDD